MLGRLTRLIERTILALGVIGGILTFFIMILVLADVTGRAAFNSPVAGSTEAAVLLMIGLIFLGMPAAQQRGQNFRIAFLHDLLSGRALVALKVFNGLACTALTATLTYFTTKIAIGSIAAGEVSYGIVSFPVWPSRALIAFGLACLTLQFLIDTIRALTGSAPDVVASSDNMQVH